MPRKAAGPAGLGQSPAGPVGRLGRPHPHTVSSAAAQQFPGGPTLCSFLPRAPPSFHSASTLFFPFLHYRPPRRPLGTPFSPLGSHPTLGHRLVQALCADTKAPWQCLQSLDCKLDL